MTPYTENVLVSTIDGTPITLRDRFVYANTSAGALAFVLPSRPLVGERHTFKDYRLTFFIHNFRVKGNGNSIEGIHTGAYGPEAVMNLSAQCATWEFAGGRWHLVEFYQQPNL